MSDDVLSTDDDFPSSSRHAFSGRPRPRRSMGRRHVVHERTFSRSLWLTLVGTLIPGLGLFWAGKRRLGTFVMGAVALLLVVSAGLWVFQRERFMGLFVDAAFLQALCGFLAVAAVLAVVMVAGTHLALRPQRLTTAQRALGAAVVGVVAFAAAAPTAFAARRSYDQANLVSQLFSTNDQVQSATKPTINAVDPWKDRDRLNILILGGDSGFGRDITLGIRTDTVMMMSINTHTGESELFQLPRQTPRMPFPEDSPLHKVFPNGFYDGKNPANLEYTLNAMYNNVPAIAGKDILGQTDNVGADVLKLSVGEAFGLKIDYYVLVNLDGFVDVIDALGGITLNVNYPIPIGSEDNKPKSSIMPGPDVEMDGSLALTYARSRYGYDDFHRMARQGCVIDAVIRQATPANILMNYEAIVRAGQKVLLTDIPSEMLPPLVDLGLKIKSQPIHRVVFDKGIGGWDSSRPNYAEMRQYVADVIAEEAPATATPEPTSSQAPPASSAAPASSAPASSSSSAAESSAAETVPASSPAAGTLADECAYHPGQ